MRRILQAVVFCILVFISLILLDQLQSVMGSFDDRPIVKYVLRLIAMFLSAALGGIIGNRSDFFINKLNLFGKKTLKLDDFDSLFEEFNIKDLFGRYEKEDPDNPLKYIERLSNKDLGQQIGNLIPNKEHNDIDGVLFSGPRGSGKTREVIELIKKIDFPSGRYEILRPKNVNNCKAGFTWGSRRKKRVILVFDELETMKLQDGLGTYDLNTSPREFEGVLEGIINGFKENCDNLWVLMTIRVDDGQWLRRSSRIDEEKFWRRFEMVELERYGREEGVVLCQNLQSIFYPHALDISAINYLAYKYDGNLQSIRDYLIILHKNIDVHDSDSLTILQDDVNDFIGVYSKDWEKKVYRKQIEPDPYKRAIFHALSIASNAQIKPFKPIIILLAQQLLSENHSHLLNSKWEITIDELCIAHHINLRSEIISVPIAYVTSLVEWPRRLKELATILIKQSQKQGWGELLQPDMMNLAATISIHFPRYSHLAKRLAHCSAEICPNDLNTLHLVGLTFSRLGDDNAAYGYLNQALGLSKDKYIAVYASIGVTLSNLKRDNDAIKILEKGRELAPTNVSILMTLGRVYEKRRRQDDALDSFQQAIKQEPENVSVLLTLGIALHRASDRKGAVEYINRALILQPDKFSAYSAAIQLIADSKLDNDLIQKLSETIVEVSQKYDGDFWTHRQLFKFFHFMGKSRNASTQLEKLLSYPEHSANEYWAIGETYYMLEKYVKTSEYYDKALNHTPNFYKALAGYGQLMNTLRQYEDGVNYFRYALAENERDSFNWAGLGSTLLNWSQISDDEHNIRLNEAKDAFIAATKIEPDAVFAWSGLLKIAQISKDSEGRKDSLNKLTVLRHDAPFVWMQMGQISSELNMLVEAAESYQKVTILLPENPLAWSYLASVQLKLGLTGEAYDSANKAYSLDGQNASIVVNKGIMAHCIENLCEAKRLFQEAIELDESLGIAWNGLGIIASKEENYNDSLFLLQKAIDLGFSTEPMTYTTMGISAKQINDTELAEKSFLRAIELKTDHPLPYSHLGEVLFKKREYKQSAEMYRLGLDIDPLNSQAWSGYGQVLNELERYDESVDVHKEAIRLELEVGVENYANYLGLGKASVGCNNISDAINAFLKSLNLYHGSPARYRLFELYLSYKGDPSHSEGVSQIEDQFGPDLDRHCERHIRHMQNKLRDIYHLAEEASTMAKRNDPYTKLKCEEVEAREPTDPKIWTILCSAYRRINEFERSCSAGHRAIALEPNYPFSYYTLGRTYEDKGRIYEENTNYQEAKKQFIKAIECYPLYHKSDAKYHKAEDALARVESVLEAEL